MKCDQHILDFEVVESPTMPRDAVALVPVRPANLQDMRVTEGEPPMLAVDFDRYLQNLARESALIVNLAVEWRKCPHADPKKPADGLPFAVGRPCFIFCCSRCFAEHEGHTEVCDG